MRLSNKAAKRAQKWLRERRKKNRASMPKIRVKSSRGTESPEERARRKTTFLIVAARGPAKGISEGQYKRKFIVTLRKIGKRNLKEPITQAEFNKIYARLKEYRDGGRPEPLYGMLRRCGFKLAFEMPGAKILQG